MNESIFKYPTIIAYLVKKIKEEVPEKQIGKTFVQKMAYLLTRNGLVKFDYSMYHYGPYSYGVSQELNFAENTGIVEIEWHDDTGYSITPTDKLEMFEPLLTDEEKKPIDKIVDEFHQYSAIELTMIVTAFFLKDNFGVTDENMVEVVNNFKKNQDRCSIEVLLKKVGLSGS